MQSSCLRKYPANDIEQGKHRMKNKEEDIEEGVPHADAGRKDKYRIACFTLY